MLNAENKLQRLKLLLSEESLQPEEICEARDILLKLSECELANEAEPEARR
jgi:hypothetical protein